MNATKEKETIKESEYEQLKEQLPNNKKVSRKKQELQQVQEELDSIVSKLRENCDHQNTVKVVKYDPNYSSEIYTPHYKTGMNIFSGNFCLDCHLFEPRKKGMPWSVCRKCGGDMKSDGHFQASQDSRGHSYKCVECGHTHETT